ncbi:hypothetical protein D3C74_287790 [compost metagenome]
MFCFFSSKIKSMSSMEILLCFTSDFARQFSISVLDKPIAALPRASNVGSEQSMVRSVRSEYCRANCEMIAFTSSKPGYGISIIVTSFCNSAGISMSGPTIMELDGMRSRISCDSSLKRRMYTGELFRVDWRSSHTNKEGSLANCSTRAIAVMRSTVSGSTAVSFSVISPRVQDHNIKRLFNLRAMALRMSTARSSSNVLIRIMP